VRREHVQPLFGTGVYPASHNAAAWKNKRMRAVLIDDGKLQITIKGRYRDRLPHSSSLGGNSRLVLTWINGRRHNLGHLKFPHLL
jgi:hypothetical protein